MCTQLGAWADQGCGSVVHSTIQQKVILFICLQTSNTFVSYKPQTHIKSTYYHEPLISMDKIIVIVSQLIPSNSSMHEHLNCLVCVVPGSHAVLLHSTSHRDTRSARTVISNLNSKMKTASIAKLVHIMQHTFF